MVILCLQVAVELTNKDVIRAHARDELGIGQPARWPLDVLALLQLDVGPVAACMQRKAQAFRSTLSCTSSGSWRSPQFCRWTADMDELANPIQASLASMVSFLVGAGIPLLAAAFIHDAHWRLISITISSTLALIAFGAVGASLGGASLFQVGDGVFMCFNTPGQLCTFLTGAVLNLASNSTFALASAGKKTHGRSRS